MAPKDSLVSIEWTPVLVDTETMSEELTGGERANLALTEWFRIRWHHRRIGHPEVWTLRVRFDELIAANSWNLAANMDELNDRYAHLYRSG